MEDRFGDRRNKKKIDCMNRPTSVEESVKNGSLDGPSIFRLKAPEVSETDELEKLESELLILKLIDLICYVER